MRRASVIMAALLLAGCAAEPMPQAPLSAAAARAAATPFTIVDAERPAFPVWQGVDLDGYAWSTANLGDRYVVVNFWASWCQPCVDEWPELQAAAAAHPSVQFVGIDSMDERASARRFLKDHPSEYRHIEDANAALLKSLEGMPNGTLPTTVILDREHRIAAWKAGPISKGQLRRALAAVMQAA